MNHNPASPRRRDLLLGAAAAAGLALLPEFAMADAPKLDLVPLPFDPSKLPGLSERLLRSHHENNYTGALKNLVAVRAKLAEVTKDTPGFAVAGLMERELTFRNSVALHELYFGNLGGNGQAGGTVAARLTQSVAHGLPLLVLDIYEHAYALDFGAAAAKYVDAFMANVQWDEVERRLSRADAAAKAIAG